MRRAAKLLTLLTVVLMPVLIPAAAQSPTLQMLDQLERGTWEVRFRGGANPLKICVRSGQELLQLRHAGFDCSRYVVEDSPEQVTVQYTCQGNGYGRTNIRRETAGLVQIEGQGIKGTSPFQFTAEARKIGTCI